MLTPPPPLSKKLDPPLNNFPSGHSVNVVFIHIFTQSKALLYEGVSSLDKMGFRSIHPNFS